MLTYLCPPNEVGGHIVFTPFLLLLLLLIIIIILSSSSASSVNLSDTFLKNHWTNLYETWRDVRSPGLVVYLGFQFLILPLGQSLPPHL